MTGEFRWSRQTHEASRKRQMMDCVFCLRAWLAGASPAAARRRRPRRRK